MLLYFWHMSTLLAANLLDYAKRIIAVITYRLVDLESQFKSGELFLCSVTNGLLNCLAMQRSLEQAERLIQDCWYWFKLIVSKFLLKTDIFQYNQMNILSLGMFHEKILKLLASSGHFKDYWNIVYTVDLEIYILLANTYKRHIYGYVSVCMYTMTSNR